MRPSNSTSLLVLLVSAACRVASATEEWIPRPVHPTTSRPFDDDEPQSARKLRDARFLADGFSARDTIYQESSNTYYSGYQQAWRMLGYYVDCSPDGDNHRRRQLNGDEEPCVRYLLWAAYVDLDYQDGGIGEYQFWDMQTKSWDRSATCNVHGNGRCAKMDCHLPGTTHWQLLGLYKEQYYASEWFEQLFKHAGYCLWEEDTYEFMQENYDAWPEGCSETDYTSEVTGNSLYLDMKPLPNANMTIALYEDARCSIEYTGSEIDVIAAMEEEGYLTRESLDAWNEAMSVWTYCQSCRAADIRQNNNNNRNRRRLDEDDPNDGYFDCDDAAGYTNVNQCMKFRTQTEMEAATYSNLREAYQQGSLLEISIGGQLLGSHVETPTAALQAKVAIETQRDLVDKVFMASWISFLAGIGVFGLVSMWSWCHRKNQGTLRESLLATSK